MLKKYAQILSNFSFSKLLGSLKAYLSIISEALSGKERDYSTGNLKEAIILLSIPMVLEMLMESAFSIADIYFVSRIGADAVATVGLTESLMTVVYSIGFGLGMATTAVISRRIGEKKPKEAANAAVQAIIAGFAVSLIFAVAGVFYSKEILATMGASPRIVNEYHMYAAISLGGNVIVMTLFIVNAIFRSAGDAAIAMRVLWLANLLNIALDPCFIFGLGPFPEMGVVGAAIATNIGRGIAVVYQFYLLFKGVGRIKLRLADVRFDLPVTLKILRLSAGTIGQYLIATASWIGLMRIVSSFGSSAVAGYTIGIRIIIFFLMPSFGMSAAAATLVGQNLGAGKPDRAERSVWKTGKYNMILLGVVALFFIFLPGRFVGLFTSDPEVFEIGVNCLRILSFGFVAYGLGMTLISSFNGAGDTATPTIINFFAFWIVEIGLAYGLAISMDFRETGVFYSIIFSEVLLTLIAAIVFKRGKWKLAKV